MQWLTHKNQRVGVEGRLWVDSCGNLVSDTEDLRTLGLVDGCPVVVDGAHAVVVGIPSNDCVNLEAPQRLPLGPVSRVYIGRITYRHGDKAIDGEVL